MVCLVQCRVYPEHILLVENIAFEFFISLQNQNNTESSIENVMNNHFHFLIYLAVIFLNKDLERFVLIQFHIRLWKIYS